MNIIKDILKKTRCRPKVSLSHHNLKVGDYVFLSKYSDADPNDPWQVGYIDEIGLDRKGGFIRCYESGQRCWRNAVKINKSEGDKILSLLSHYHRHYLTE